MCTLIVNHSHLRSIFHRTTPPARGKKGGQGFDTSGAKPDSICWFIPPVPSVCTQHYVKLSIGKPTHLMVTEGFGGGVAGGRGLVLFPYRGVVFLGTASGGSVVMPKGGSIVDSSGSQVGLIEQESWLRTQEQTSHSEISASLPA